MKRTGMLLGFLLAGCMAAPTTDSPVLVGAGDIARCNATYDEATANLLDDIPGTVFTLGDNVYEEGTPEQFADCYDPSWGRHKDRTRPAVGNHEYYLYEDAAPYFDYFGEAAGEHGQGWYSYDLGEWHIVVLNSECEYVGGCDDTSEQGQWLAADLETHSDSLCTLAYWHTPRFGLHSNLPDNRSEYFWEVLYDHGADVILGGHEHYYVRFAPLNPDGDLDEGRGIREFIVGTGGGELYGYEFDAEHVDARARFTHGVLKLTLHADSYDWEFIRAGGLPYTDLGSGECH